MSTECKTRLEVQKILKANISTGLTKLNQTGWAIQEFANASFVKNDKVILLNLISADRAGWQITSYGISGNSLQKSDEWIELQSWQVHVILKRNDNITDASILAEDVCQMLIAWFNGYGCEYFRKYGLSNLLIDKENIFVYNDNSDLYQKRCVFTVKILVPKVINWTEDSLEALVPKILPV